MVCASSPRTFVPYGAADPLINTPAPSSPPATPRFDRTFTGLPVLIVPSFDVVTPELLESTYEDFVRRQAEWDYERLTRRYWMDMVFNVADTGKSGLVLEQHPMRRAN